MKSTFLKCVTKRSAMQTAKRAGSLIGNRVVKRITKRVGAAGLALMTTLSLVACGSASQADVVGPKIRIGIKFDQPGISVEQSGTYSGFAVDTARYVAEKLGYAPKQIVFKQVTSAQRESLLQNGTVDMIVDTYTITKDRQKVVDFAGPFFVAGQDLLIRKTEKSEITSPRDLANKKVCSATGSTSAKIVQDYFPKTTQLMLLNGYSECLTALLSGTVDAVTTDDLILATLAAAKADSSLMVVGHPFTEESYGIGVKKGSAVLVEKINEALKSYVSSGAWQRAIDKATKGTGYKPNSKFNPPTRFDARASDQIARF